MVSCGDGGGVGSIIGRAQKYQVLGMSRKEEGPTKRDLRGTWFAQNMDPKISTVRPSHDGGSDQSSVKRRDRKWIEAGRRGDE